MGDCKGHFVYTLGVKVSINIYFFINGNFIRGLPLKLQLACEQAKGVWAKNQQVIYVSPLINTKVKWQWQSFLPVGNKVDLQL